MSSHARMAVSSSERHEEAGLIHMVETSGSVTHVEPPRLSLRADRHTGDWLNELRSKSRFCLVVASLWLVTLLLAFDNPVELLIHNWPITPVAFIAAAFANATAIGGGFLFVPLFIFGYGLNPTAALKLSLATQAFGMSFGAIGWSRRFIVMRAFQIASVASVIGMAIGTYGFTVSNSQIKSIFAWVSLFIFIVIMLEMRFGGGSTYHEIRNDSLVKKYLFVMASLGGGMITAWTAIGIGEVVALFLLFVYRIRIDAAIGTGVAVLAVDSIAGLVCHTQIGGIFWEYLVFTVPGVILGGYFGARLGRVIEHRTTTREGSDKPAAQTGQSPLKWLFGIVIFLDSMVMLTQHYVF